MGENWWEEVDEEEEEQKREYENFKEFVVFLVDAGPKMFKKSGNESCSFDAALDCTLALMRNKILCSANDQVAICFWGTRESQNDLAFEHVYVLSSLDFPTAQRIKELEKLHLEDGRSEFDRRVGSKCSDRGRALEQGLRVASNLLQKGGGAGRGVSMRVLLFTNDDHPGAAEHQPGGSSSSSSSAHHHQILARMQAMTEQSQTVELLATTSESLPFDMSKFYQEAALQAGGLEAMVEKMQNIKNAVRRKFSRKRRLRALWLHLGPQGEAGGRIAVGMYGTLQKATKGTTVQLEAGNLEPLQVESAHICQDTGAVITDLRHFSYPYAGAQVVFDNEEVIEVKRHLTSGLHLVGFKPRSELKDFMQLRKSNFIYPDEQSGKGSTCAFIALHQKMLELDRIAVVWAQLSPTTMPRLGVLVAQEEEVCSESGHQVEPPGMNLITLPFSQDIRHPEPVFGGGDGEHFSQVEEEDVCAAEQVVLALQLEDFNCRDVENPALQKHFTMLEQLALDYDKEEAEVDLQDFTLPDNQGMQRAEAAVTAFKAQVYGAHHDREEEEARQAASAKSISAAKRKHNTLEQATQVTQDIDWDKHMDNGTLAKLTVEKLKSYCVAHKVPHTGCKKDGLVHLVAETIKKQRL